MLKFIGDGVLAIFPLTGAPAEACEAALRAVIAARAGMAHLDAVRQAQGLPPLPFAFLAAAICAVTSASGSLFLPSAAQAQLEEIVVTARARTESLQDVPSTVTAFTAGQLSDMGVTNFVIKPFQPEKFLNVVTKACGLQT